MPQEQFTAIGALAVSFDMPSENNSPTLSDAEAELVAGLTQEFTYESGTTFRYPEEFVLVGVDNPPVTVGINEEIFITMIDPTMMGIPANEPMEKVVGFSIGSAPMEVDDFESLDIGGREAVFASAFAPSNQLYQSMALVRFADETVGIMDILTLAEPTDDQIDIIRSVAASFNSASTEVGITRADIDEARALFEEAMAIRDDGDNEGAIDLFTQAIDLNPDL